MLRYSLPDFTVGLSRNMLFIRLHESNPELFQDDVVLDSVYGCFPDCIVNGGRAFVRERAHRHEMERTFELLNAHGVKARLTFTNMLVGREHLSDAYFNEILDVASGFDVEAIVASELVADYIARRHGFPLTLSTTVELLDVEEINDATARYDQVVLNYGLNKDRSVLARLAHPERIEVMVNELCRPNCPLRRSHYMHNSADQLARSITPFQGCDPSRLLTLDDAEGSPTVLSSDDVRRLSEEFGIGSFKIVGRGMPGDVVVDSYVRYLIKPRYQEATRSLLGRML